MVLSRLKNPPRDVISDCHRFLNLHGLWVGYGSRFLYLPPTKLVFKGPVLWTANNHNWTGLGLEKTGTAVPVFQFLGTKDRGSNRSRTATL